MRAAKPAQPARFVAASPVVCPQKPWRTPARSRQRGLPLSPSRFATWAPMLWAPQRMRRRRPVWPGPHGPGLLSAEPRGAIISRIQTALAESVTGADHFAD